MRKIDINGVIESNPKAYTYKNGELIADYFRKALQKDPLIDPNEVIFLLTITHWLKYPFKLNGTNGDLENKFNKDLLLSIGEKLFKNSVIFDNKKALKHWTNLLLPVTFMDKNNCPYDKMTQDQKIHYMMSVSYALKKICLDYIARQGITAPT